MKAEELKQEFADIIYSAWYSTQGKHTKEMSELMNDISEMAANNIIASYAQSQLPKEECVNCDKEKEVHNICSECLHEIINENKTLPKEGEEVWNKEAIELVRKHIPNNALAKDYILELLKRTTLSLPTEERIVQIINLYEDLKAKEKGYDGIELNEANKAYIELLASKVKELL